MLRAGIRQRRNTRKMVSILTVIILLICIPLLCDFIPQLKHTVYHNITVTEKAIKRSSSSDEKYLVFTKDQNGQVRVFENTDNMISNKFDSSDMFAQMKEGETYDIETVGYRVPFLSMYENIISIKQKSN